MKKVVIGNTLRLTGFSPSEEHALQAKATLPNPLYYKLVKMGKTRALYACTPEFKYWKKQKDGSLELMRGMLKDVKEIGGNFTIENQTSFPRVGMQSSIKLRSYQEDIPEKIIGLTDGVLNPDEPRSGIIRLGTGFGKTIIALRIADLLWTRTLIIVPRRKILQQFYDETKKYFGFEAEGIKGLDGKVGDGAAGISPITVVTIQSLQRFLNKVSDVDLCRRQFGCVIADEAHLTVPKNSRRCVSFFASRFLFGLTATPRRTDGQGKALEFIYGPILVDAELPREKPTIEILQTTGKIPMGEYNSIIDKHILYDERNKLIAETAAREAEKGRTVIIFTKRVEHARLCHKLLVSHGYGADCVLFARASTFVQELADFKCRTRRDCPRILVGTFSLLSTGIDLPSLDTMIIAGDLKSDVLAEQSVGRILRIFDGKKNPKIIDVQDLGNPILRAQGRSRKKFYESLGWQTSFI